MGFCILKFKPTVAAQREMSNIVEVAALFRMQPWMVIHYLLANTTEISHSRPQTWSTIVSIVLLGSFQRR